MANLDLDKVIAPEVVINSWDVVNGVYYANQGYNEFPDYKNNILIKWNWQTVPSASGNVTVVYDPEDLTVVDTKYTQAINSLWSKLRVDWMYWGNEWVDVWSNTPLQQTLTGTPYWAPNSTTTFRFWTNFTLPAGKIVWKKIKWFSYYNISDISYFTVTMQYSVKLLHSNWTYTTLATFDPVVAWGTNKEMLEYTWAWETTQEGDILIWEIHFTGNVNVQNNRTISFYPWKEWSTYAYSLQDWCRPLQISIE